MKKHFFFVLGMVCALSNASGQSLALSVGDTVPARIYAAANLPTSTRKAVIIDFWETWCSACLYALPRLQDLQKAFDSSLSVVTVTQHATRQQVALNIARLPEGKQVSIAVIVHDSLLSAAFPHVILPHTVWIGADHVIRAITGTDSVNADNVRRFVNGDRMNWPVKKDLTRFDYQQPMMVPVVPGPPSGLSFYSSLSPLFQGVTNGRYDTIDSLRGIRVINYYNHSLPSLLRLSVEGVTASINPKLIVGDSLLPAGATYSFSVALPAHLSDSVVQLFVRTECARWLAMATAFQMTSDTLTMPCLSLVRTVSKKRPVLTSKTIWDLLWLVNEGQNGLPWVINGSGLPDTARFPIPTLSNSSSLPDWRRALLPLGFDLIPVRLPLQVYIVRRLPSSSLQNH